MAEHSTLTGANLHEPKGADSAVIGSRYVSNGAGSGDWIRTQGWAQFQDTQRAVVTPTQNIATGIRTLWTSDGGFLTVEKNPSDAVASLWNTTTNKIIPIAAFDIFHIRLAFVAENYSGTTPYLTFELDIGGGIGTIYTESIDLRKGGAASPHGFSFPVFAGATFLANGGEIYVTYTGTGTCDLYANDILIVRESKNYV